MSTSPVFALFAFAAIVNAGTLGVALLVRGRGSHLLWLGLMFLCIAYLLSIYTLELYDRVWIGGWIRVTYDGVSLLLSCFLLESVARGLQHRRPPRSIYLLPVAYLVVLASLQNRFLDWLTIERLVLAQSIYTVAALVVCVRATEAPWRSGRWGRTWTHLFAISLAFLTVHVAHLVRALTDASWSQGMASVIGIVALIAMTSYALTSTQLSGWRGSRPRLARDESRRLLDQLEKVIRDQRLFVQPNLDLKTLAAAVGTSSQNLSAALNAELGRSFYEYVTAFRVEEAKSLLESDDGALSLEAIGSESGFKSRSSFYNAFKTATGMTPGEYRRAQSE